ncbi:hypothetical protein AVL56_04385 [Alteromonas stellipolaris]|uniref:hypothetical protein n=1 Tax=Alteromonas stellipolaris TaxID=233316 RepID=UPI00077039C3|nr:hypothetical protein [Alteromonas stellipolaris]AMJ93614.1 hypothetical protein AVL56_04385 [Alteromonas stellipolaris]
MLNKNQLLTNTTSFQPLTDALVKAGLHHFISVVHQATALLFSNDSFDHEVLSDLAHATADFIDDDFSVYQGLFSSGLIEFPQSDSIVSTYINEKHPVIDAGFLAIGALSVCYDAINHATGSQEQASVKHFSAANELIGIARLSSALIDKLDEEEHHRQQIKKLTPKPPMSNAAKAKLKAKQFNEKCDRFLIHLEQIALFVLDYEPYTPIGAITSYVHESCFYKKRQLKEMGLELPSEERMKSFLLNYVPIPKTAIYKGRAPFKAINTDAPATNFAQLVEFTLLECSNPLLFL